MNTQSDHNLKQLRKQKRLTQKEAALQIGISLRSYQSYETNPALKNTLKYRFIISELERINRIDEENGILRIKDIQEGCAEVFRNYPVEACILFGSYAKNTASPSSDIDLVVSADVQGLQFYELAESLREQLHKRIDLLDVKQLVNNKALLKEVLRDGIRIYGQSQG